MNGGRGELGATWPELLQFRLAAAASVPVTPESLTIVRQISRLAASAAGESGFPLVSSTSQSRSSCDCSSAVSAVCARTSAWQVATATPIDGSAGTDGAGGGAIVAGVDVVLAVVAPPIA
jgi:hypothetical protein